MFNFTEPPGFFKDHPIDFTQPRIMGRTLSGGSDAYWMAKVRPQTSEEIEVGEITSAHVRMLWLGVCLVLEYQRGIDEFEMSDIHIRPDLPDTWCFTLVIDGISKDYAIPHDQLDEENLAKLL